MTAEDGAQRGCEQPDLVITDIIMPEQEGSLTITQMRKAGPDSKVIAVPGRGRVGDTDFSCLF